MTSTSVLGILGSVASLLLEILYQGNYYDMNHKLWNISCEIQTPYTGAAEMLLHINGKFKVGKLKSPRLSYSLVLTRSPLLIS